MSGRCAAANVACSRRRAEPMSSLRVEAEATAYLEGADDARLVRSKRIIWLISLLLIAAFAWAYHARLDEVTTGSGRVIPTLREQLIQSPQGGILAELLVREDDIVEPGQVLARLDPTRSESNVEESAARYRAALASAARLEAEVNGAALTFPEELQEFPELIAAETELFETRRRSLEQSTHWI